jgi:acyl-CoA thioester hydrolase
MEPFLRSELPLPSDLDGFPVVIELAVQWGDHDAFGHVNNTVYFRWYESVRIAYLERLGFADRNSPNGLGPILAAIGCNYRRQVTYPDRVLIAARVVRIGRSSMLMEHKVWSTAQKAVVADGQSTVVAFDYAAAASREVPADMRAAIRQLEGKDL